MSSKNPQGDYIQGFPPVDAGTVIYTSGVVNCPVEAILNFGGVSIVDREKDIFCAEHAEPIFAENYGFGKTGSVEVVFGTPTGDIGSTYFIGNGIIQTLTLPDDTSTLARDLPKPTSLVVSVGFRSVLVERSGRVSRYEHPRDTVVRLVNEVNSDPSLITDEALLIPLENAHLFFGGCFLVAA